MMNIIFDFCPWILHTVRKITKYQPISAACQHSQCVCLEVVRKFAGLEREWCPYWLIAVDTVLKMNSRSGTFVLRVKSVTFIMSARCEVTPDLSFADGSSQRTSPPVCRHRDGSASHSPRPSSRSLPGTTVCLAPDTLVDLLSHPEWHTFSQKTGTEEKNNFYFTWCFNFFPSNDKAQVNTGSQFLHKWIFTVHMNSAVLNLR